MAPILLGEEHMLEKVIRVEENMGSEEDRQKARCNKGKTWMHTWPISLLTFSVRFRVGTSSKEEKEYRKEGDEVHIYCLKNSIPFEILLILENAPGNPPHVDDLNQEVKVVYLPPNVTAVIQPMDQGAIATFKAYYLQTTFALAIAAIDGTADKDPLSISPQLLYLSHCSPGALRPLHNPSSKVLTLGLAVACQEASPPPQHPSNVLQDTTGDESKETEGCRANKLRRTRKKVTKPHISSTEVGEMDISISEERIRKQMVCNKLGDASKPVVGPGSAESDQPHDDKNSNEQVIVIKPSLPETSVSTSGSEFNLNSNDTDHTRDNTQFPTLPQLFSRIKHIKQETTTNHLQFVRFEATDLHGVSRSKTIPAHFFQEKVIHGVYMPRGYLELIPNPKDNEVNHIRATCFNSDIVLMPELSTFKVLPWAERTARVICDTFTVTGDPLLTSPRYIAKRQLNHLQDSGFSLRSAFIYDFCIFGVPEIITSKTISFPVSPLLNNHEQRFMHELIDGLYQIGANVESFSSYTRPGHMEICFLPEFGISTADNAFTLRTGVKELGRKYNYIASFFIETGFCNSGILSHSLWDVSEKQNVFCSSSGVEGLTMTGKKWLAGLLKHSAALSCLMAPAVSCRKRYSKESKDLKQSVPTTWGYNDNSCAFNIKCHGEKGTRIENKLGSATANPYLVLAATIAAGLDGLQSSDGVLAGPEDSTDFYQPKPSEIPLKLEDALVALEEDQCLRQALGETFIRYFVAMKKYELENQETDAERNKFLEYFI
ncbi:lengsin [Trichechus manatus latirostris]|uniref:Lengsin n=1 Tax=Trichechus manatus latirostris TaxID=127582 RepID=A0A2Y9DUW4_TRIMA|nr:lengsin [Trichechus manatus latirostris]